MKNLVLNKKTIFSFLISLAIIFYIFSSVDIQHLILTLNRTNFFYFFFAFLCFYMSILIKSYRWKLLLSNLKISLSLKETFIIFYISMFVNSITPAKLGDVYRAYLLKKKKDSSMSSVLGTIFIERFFDLVTMLSLISISGYLAFKSYIPEAIKNAIQYGFIIITLLPILAFLIILINKKTAKKNLLYTILLNFEKGLRTINLNILPIIILLSILAWLIEGLTFYFIFLSLNINLSLAFSIFTDLSSSLLTAIPFTPSGLGIVEYSLLYILSLKSIPKVLALAIIILYRLISYLSIILFGSLLNTLFLRKLR
ncbi:conserved hypothetical protein [Methanocaldococcus infernus ME]|uniref:Lysylphosphatidylglycerol synthetase/UPF0104 n=1 Tax=Methanocaldococcus infernus (strain DSM 11812 / JCM 15783 / ME) TaxID=573063 RepID=D5VR62_METIM|nr:flippase-like domain-containing protein [Methanocaldococcus infernus]ADG13065.1 conserved hypothetical protein [Methanocaldococcus infernus ME]